MTYRTPGCLLCTLCWVLAAAVGCSSGSGPGSSEPNDAGPGDTGGLATSSTPDSGVPDTSGTDAAQLAPPGCSVAAPSSPPFGMPVITCDGGGVDGGDNLGALSVCLSGGLSEAFSANGGYGSIDANTLDWTYYPSQTSSASTDFRIIFASAIPVDQVGSFAVAVKIVDGLGVDAGVWGWQTEAGACTVNITSSSCAPDFTFPNRRILTGTGDCAKPAAPQSGTPAGPVNVGPFTFIGMASP
jgi:hypothetical protein